MTPFRIVMLCVIALQIVALAMQIRMFIRMKRFLRKLEK